MNGTRDDATNTLRVELEQRLGSPGKWEMLFRSDGGLLQTLADRTAAPPRFDNPTLRDLNKKRSAFVPYEASVPAVHDWSVLDAFREAGLWEQLPRFLLAGERAQYALNPGQLTVGIVIAGGPAAGLNMVTDSIVKRHFSLATLSGDAGARHNLQVFGYRKGYVGLRTKDRVRLAPSTSALKQASYPQDEPVWFSDEWATDAGVRLKTLREKPVKDADAKRQLARQDAEVIRQEQLDILYVIGGNGTLAWAAEIGRALTELGAKDVVLVGGPKTMDNDVNFTDATFGFRTAVDNAAAFIRTVHTTAEAMDRLGVIELFGAASGFIALHAGYVSGVADYILIPEPPAPDEQKVIAYLDRRIQKNGHAVLVVAEGALSAFQHGAAEQKQEAFNVFLGRLRERYGALVDVRARYLMRDTAPNSFDLELCKWSGKLMVDTALAGFTRCSVNLWQGDYVLVPFEAATAQLKQVAPWSYFLQTLLDRERLGLHGASREHDTTENWFG
jgi:6-phosphofructokinase 1